MNLLSSDDVILNEFEYINERTIRSAESKPKYIKQIRNLDTCRIERPTCTTPFRFAPFEEFVKAASAPSTHYEKIKLSLPGEQFISSDKSRARKSDSKTWLDFCEKALFASKNERLAKTLQNAESDTSASLVDAFTSISTFQTNSTPSTVTIDLESNWSPFCDNFDPFTHHNND